MDAKKIDQALKLLNSIKSDDIELAYSGGKDSDVILELAKMSGIKFEAIYKNTTVDPPGTIAHVKENGVTIVRPKMSFFDIIKKKGIPSRTRRFCCEILKEYKIKDTCIQGIRRSESVRRAKRYTEPISCRIYGKTEHVKIYLPILYWTNEDVADFIKDRNIKLATAYYDENGELHTERRLGCVGCPLNTKNAIKEFMKYPKFAKSVITCADIYLKTHYPKNGKNRYENGAEMFYSNYFCDSYDEYLRKKYTLFGETDIKKELENYFKIKL